MDNTNYRNLTVLENVLLLLYKNSYYSYKPVITDLELLWKLHVAETYLRREEEEINLQKDTEF